MKHERAGSGSRVPSLECIEPNAAGIAVGQEKFAWPSQPIDTTEDFGVSEKCADRETGASLKCSDPSPSRGEA
jgi:hypothetical protein